MFKSASYRPAALMIALAVIVFDQISKWFVTEALLRPRLSNRAAVDFIHWLKDAPAPMGYTEIPYLPFFGLTMVWNKGVSFGLLNAGQAGGPMGLVIVSLIVSALFLVWLMRTHSKAQAACLALVIGGALGNVIDRLRFGAVIDFLDFHLGAYRWPAFNVADSAIVVGVILLIVHSIFLDRKTGKDVD